MLINNTVFIIANVLFVDLVFIAVIQNLYLKIFKNSVCIVFNKKLGSLSSLYFFNRKYLDFLIQLSDDLGVKTWSTVHKINYIRNLVLSREI